MSVVNARNVFVSDGGSSTHTSSSGSTHGGTGRSIDSGSGFVDFLSKLNPNAFHSSNENRAGDLSKLKYITPKSHSARLKQIAVNDSMNIGFSSSGSPVGDTTGTIPNDSTTRTSSVGVSNGGQFGNYMDMLRQIQNENNAFNLQQTEMVNAFNAAEAQKNRDWQQYMSENAHQIEVADLQKAGLNPVLSALNGNGASVGSGAVASGQKAVADDTTSRGVIGIINGLINATTATAVANIYANASIQAAGISAGAARYSADSHSSAARYSADVNSSAMKYSADRSAISNLVGSVLRTLF